ncbi:hypothetical protein CCACVL1_02055 [Corchorus capsularis]|uniref:Uncharacterized protein n=1 Tax=Corchorus capsularis TaxID=210143 RepID=A0A1R3KDG4_COCAP|nr:hypothetical protein CCACVL1_02055 [Corchorus capsularis]
MELPINMLRRRGGGRHLAKALKW